MNPLQVRWTHYRWDEPIAGEMNPLQVWTHCRWDEPTAGEMNPLQVRWTHYRWDEPLQVKQTHYRWDEPTTGEMNPLQVRQTHYRWDEPTAGEMNPLQVRTDMRVCTLFKTVNKLVNIANGMGSRLVQTELLLQLRSDQSVADRERIAFSYHTVIVKSLFLACQIDFKHTYRNTLYHWQTIVIILFNSNIRATRLLTMCTWYDTVVIKSVSNHSTAKLTGYLN